MKSEKQLEAGRKASLKWLANPENRERTRKYQRERACRKRAMDREGENAKWREWRNKRYADDPEFREKVKARVRARTAKLKAENPEAWAADTRKRVQRHRMRRFGLAPDAFEKMRADQGNVCAICKQPETVVKRHRVCELSVDHDHTSGAVRKLLCLECNRGLGAFKDSTHLLWTAFQYLVDHRKLKLVS